MENQFGENVYCINCTYFEQYSIGRWHGAADRYPFGTCTSRWMKEAEDQPDVHGVLASNEEGRARLSIGPYFGCIHWEKKTVKA